jgi:Peptidase family C25
MSIKIIVTNLSALAAKYGSAGLRDINAALRRLVSADAGRNLQTRIIDIADASAMRTVRGAAVRRPGDERATKKAVDAIYRSLEPAYIMILGAGDVVCHVNLSNPIDTVEDDDSSVPSDLPYASDAPFSRKIQEFLGPGRVVGRLPDIKGSNDATVLVKLIDLSAAHTTRPRRDFAKPFAITAQIWQGSTTMSIANAFGSGHTVLRAPPSKHPGINAGLGARSWFINCHGAASSPEFFGENPGGSQPVAMESAQIAGRVKEGTVAAAECCYGAELYDPAIAGVDMPMCNQALLSGAAAYMGSTNIAYGPPNGNDAADLITQFFLMKILDGASSGRALLQARQRFIRDASMSDPANLKTIGQFLLLGDPSLQPCEAAQPHGATVDGGAAIARRRMLLAADGKAAQRAATFPVRAKGKTAAMRSKPVATLVKKLGYNLGKAVGYKVDGGSDIRFAMKSMRYAEEVVAVAKLAGKSGGPAKRIKLLVARVKGLKVSSYKEYVSR